MAGGPEDGAVNSVDFLEDGSFFFHVFGLIRWEMDFFPWMKMLEDGFIFLDYYAEIWIFFLSN